MTPERWEAVNAVFRRALETEPADRAAVLDDACAGDDDLRAEVERLLGWHEQTGEFLEPPVNGALGRIADAFEVATLLREADGDGAWTVAREDERLGAVLDGKYRIETLLGAGGMGTVYRATQIELDRTVAVKMMRVDARSDEESLARFRREAVAVARLKHPNVVAVYDFGVADGLGAYIVMEYLEGRSLRHELAERRALPAAEAVRVAREALAALAAAHAAGVVHRDVKPENVFLETTGDGVVTKVLDFGIAKLAAAAEARLGATTRSGAVLGTPLYMSPEQCRGEPIDARSDLYSLGCVLYEALAGRPPFRADSNVALIYKHLDEAPVPPSRLVDGVPDAVDAAVLRALAKRAEDRFPSADAFADALLASKPVDARRPSGLTRVGGRTTGDGRAAGKATNNLPLQATRFVGRERDLLDVVKALHGERLVTLTGPGGIGKTRLALEAAAALVGEYANGVRLVELASARDGASVAAAIAAALGVREDPGRRLEDAILAELGGRELVLVLDNCEHVVEPSALLVARILRECPAIRVLATSREPLRVGGEVVWLVPPLAVPDEHAERSPDRLLEVEAVRLFVDRAALARPGFAAGAANASALVRTARRLEGIPLAIELAAALARSLSVEQIADRLDDRFRLLRGGRREAPSRHRTLRATIDWSYELLDESERQLLRRLAVFSGGWTLEAAEAVCGGDEVLEGLTRLVDTSLVTAADDAGPLRYGMLETIRAYAADALEASGEEPAIRAAHAAVFLALAEEAEPGLFGSDAPRWLAHLTDEHDNLRAALEWLRDHDGAACLRLAVAIRNLWMTQGYYSEGRRWLELALEAGGTAPALTRVVGLRAVGYVAKQQGDLDAARRHMEHSVEVARATGDLLQIAHSSRGLGAVAQNQGDLETARRYLEESLEIGRALDDDRVASNALRSLGEVARLQADWAAARDYYERSAAAARASGDRVSQSMSLVNLGAVAWETGDLDAAVSCFRDALAVELEMNSRSEISVTLDGLAAVAAARGAYLRGARLAGAADALRAAIGFELEPVDRAVRDRCLADLRARLGTEALEAALEDGRALSFDRAIAEARSVE